MNGAVILEESVYETVRLKNLRFMKKRRDTFEYRLKEESIQDFAGIDLTLWGVVS